MRILLINDYGIEIGGAETYLKNLKQALRDQGHDVRVLTSKSDDALPSFSDYTFKGLNVNSLFRLLPYIFNMSSYRALKQIRKDFQPDIVHLHFTFYHTSPSVLLALKNVPTVMTTHAHEIIAPVGVDYSAACNHPFIGYCIKCTGVLKYYPEVIKRIIFRTFSKRIKLFIAPSNYYADIIKQAKYSPVIRIYNGIFEKSTYNPVSMTGQNILFVGRLAPEKGAEYAIQALPLIHKKLPHVTLTIVGDGPDKERLKKMISELNISKYVTMAGKVPNKETEKYYKKSSLVIVPSIYPDNLPTVCIEAMNNGRLLLASNIGGLPELVTSGKNGYLFKPGDIEDIANKTIKIFSNNNKLKELSINSRNMIKNFNMQLHTKNLLSHYKNILNK